MGMGFGAGSPSCMAGDVDPMTSGRWNTDSPLAQDNVVVKFHLQKTGMASKWKGMH